ncbi:MAG: 3'-5' exonuclease [Gammaproteobacteria bacterium]
MNVFIFDIETIPDTDSGRRLYQLDGLSDEDVAKAMVALRQEKSKTEMLPLYLQKVVAISVALRQQDKFNVWSLGDRDTPEKELIQRFYAGIEKYMPTIVSWNGNGFDLPVLHYRSLLHKVPASCYWETGNHDQSFRWNNYLNRYHYRHIDLMDVLAAYNFHANAPLDAIATMLGFPGKMGMEGSQVWGNYLQGKIENIRHYCETDVLNTYLVYLRFELIRGILNEEIYEQECETVKEFLRQKDQPHFTEFLQKWQD